MKIFGLIGEGLFAGVVAFAVSALVSGLWSQGAHGSFSADWES